MSALKVSATAPGKVNLYFAVGPVREDGYHPVASLYSAVSLKETVTVTESQEKGISLSLALVAGSALEEMALAGDFDPATVPLDECNLAYKAAELILAEQGLSTASVGLHLHIDKEVPVAGGMAGGSADAAAALKAINEFVVRAGWAEAELSQERLRELGASLGADVPFCLLGGLAVGYGVGEELTPIEVPEGVEPLPLSIVLNKRGLSTPAVFKKLDEARATGELSTPSLEDLRVPQELIDVLTKPGKLDIERLVELMRNDLQAPAVMLAPELAETLAVGNRPETTGAMVSGSGPTVFSLVTHQGAIQQKVSIYDRPLCLECRTLLSDKFMDDA